MVNDSKYGSYWVIEDSKDIFKNEKDIKKLQKMSASYLLNIETDKILNPINNKPIRFINKSKQEFIHGKQSRLLSKSDFYKKHYYNNKLRLITSIDDLISNASIKYSSPLTHKSSLFPNGFDNFQGIVLIDNNLYSYIVRIGKNINNENIFYDIVLTYIEHKKRN